MYIFSPSLSVVCRFLLLYKPSSPPPSPFPFLVLLAFELLPPPYMSSVCFFFIFSLLSFPFSVHLSFLFPFPPFRLRWMGIAHLAFLGDGDNSHVVSPTLIERDNPCFLLSLMKSLDSSLWLARNFFIFFPAVLFLLTFRAISLSKAKPNKWF